MLPDLADLLHRFQDLQPIQRQAVTLPAASWLVGNGHLDQAGGHEGGQMLVDEMLAVAQSRDLLQGRARQWFGGLFEGCQDLSGT